PLLGCGHSIVATCSVKVISPPTRGEGTSRRRSTNPPPPRWGRVGAGVSHGALAIQVHRNTEPPNSTLPAPSGKLHRMSTPESQPSSAAPKHVYLVDGSGYIFRAFHALPPMTRADGTPVNAVLGFTNMLLQLIEQAEADEAADYFAVI